MSAIDINMIYNQLNYLEATKEEIRRALEDKRSNNIIRPIV